MGLRRFGLWSMLYEKTESRNPKAASKNCLEISEFKLAIVSEPYFLSHWKMFSKEVENKKEAHFLLSV